MGARLMAADAAQRAAERQRTDRIRACFGECGGYVMRGGVAASLEFILLSTHRAGLARLDTERIETRLLRRFETRELAFAHAIELDAGFRLTGGVLEARE